MQYIIDCKISLRSFGNSSLADYVPNMSSEGLFGKGGIDQGSLQTPLQINPFGNRALQIGQSKSARISPYDGSTPRHRPMMDMLLKFGRGADSSKWDFSK